MGSVPAIRWEWVSEAPSAPRSGAMSLRRAEAPSRRVTRTPGSLAKGQRPLGPSARSSHSPRRGGRPGPLSQLTPAGPVSLVPLRLILAVARRSDVRAADRVPRGQVTVHTTEEWCRGAQILNTTRAGPQVRFGRTPPAPSTGGCHERQYASRTQHGGPPLGAGLHPCSSRPSRVVTRLVSCGVRRHA